jgi:hypothetical protein
VVAEEKENVRRRADVLAFETGSTNVWLPLRKGTDFPGENGGRIFLQKL